MTLDSWKKTPAQWKERLNSSLYPVSGAYKPQLMPQSAGLINRLGPPNYENIAGSSYYPQIYALASFDRKASVSERKSKRMSKAAIDAKSTRRFSRSKDDSVIFF